ncbi:autoinducer 2 import system permease LsrD [Microbacterium sp.]|uniref:ABC transporter permease subunit n=1 Tax=Microbacterium sp. TaxID=51671 RepID=UPI0026181F6E|nr:autoinducer 2 import system permease LsrD [Microbacterium sp.]
MNALKARLKPFARWEVSLIGVLILELIIFSTLSPKFLDPNRLLFSMSDFIYLGIIALPLAVVMITGGIDISFASIASLSSIMMGVAFKTGANIWVSVLVGLAAAVAAGLVNGLLIIVTRANPMVITLGTQFLFAGLALAASGLAGVSAFEGVSGLPEEFTAIAGGRTLGLPNMLIVFIIFAVLFAILLARTTFGRQARLIGANPIAARYAGFRSDAVIIGAYILTALAAGVVGLLLSSYVGSARADVGSALLMPVLTLVVIGGVSMYGGEGTIFGVIVATFVIGFLQQGLRFAGLTENEVAVFTGVILVTVASLRWWSGRWSERVRNSRVRRENLRQMGMTAEAKRADINV